MTKGEEFLTVWRMYPLSDTVSIEWPSCQGADASVENLNSMDFTEAILISVVTSTRCAASSRGGRAVPGRTASLHLYDRAIVEQNKRRNARRNIADANRDVG